MKQYILTIERGIASSQCAIFSKDGTIVSLAPDAFEQHYPNYGWVERVSQNIVDKTCRQWFKS